MRSYNRTGLSCLLLVFVLLLAGCGQVSDSAGTGSGAQPVTPTALVRDAPRDETSAPPTPTSTPVAMPPATAEAPTVLATLQRSGGFAGLTNTTTVWTYGRVEIDSGPVTTFEMPSDQLRQLRERLSSAGWKRLSRSYGQPMPDAFEYVVTASGKTVRTYDAANSPPSPWS